MFEKPEDISIAKGTIATKKSRKIQQYRITSVVHQPYYFIFLVWFWHLLNDIKQWISDSLSNG